MLVRRRSRSVLIPVTLIAVGSLAELFEVFASPVEVTVAVFVTLGSAGLATPTVSTSVLDAPGASGPAFEQVIVWPFA